MRRWCLPQTMSVGALMRCRRFFSPLSGIGQMNFDVAAIALARSIVARAAACCCSGVGSAGGRAEDELADVGGVHCGDLGGEHAAEGVADEVDGCEAEGVEKVEVEDG